MIFAIRYPIKKREVEKMNGIEDKSLYINIVINNKNITPIRIMVLRTLVSSGTIPSSKYKIVPPINIYIMRWNISYGPR
jgi:hypothetical protein